MYLPHKIETCCSGCMNDVVLDTVRGTATTHVPYNGGRGKSRVPAHDAVADIVTDDNYGDELLMWDCGECGYADSFDTTAPSADYLQD